MNVWQLQEAKAKLSEVVNLCNRSPQIISLRGVNKVIMINMEEYQQLTKTYENIVSFFRNSPLNGIELNIERDKSPQRELDL